MFIDSLVSGSSLTFRRYQINDYKKRQRGRKNARQAERSEGMTTDMGHFGQRWHILATEMAHFPQFNTVIVAQEGHRKCHTGSKAAHYMWLTAKSSPSKDEENFIAPTPRPHFLIFSQPTFLFSRPPHPRLRNYTITVTVSDRVTIESCHILLS